MCHPRTSLLFVPLRDGTSSREERAVVQMCALSLMLDRCQNVGSSASIPENSRRLALMRGEEVDTTVQRRCQPSLTQAGQMLTCLQPFQMRTRHRRSSSELCRRWSCAGGSSRCRRCVTGKGCCAQSHGVRGCRESTTF